MWCYIFLRVEAKPFLGEARQCFAGRRGNRPSKRHTTAQAGGKVSPFTSFQGIWKTQST